MEAAQQERSSTSQVHASVAGVALAGALTLAVGEGPWDLWSTMVGVMLIVILWAFVDRSKLTGPSNEWEAAAFSLVFGLCIVLILGFAVEIVLRGFAPHGELNTISSTRFWKLQWVDPQDPGEVVTGKEEERAEWTVDVVELIALGIWALVATGMYFWVRQPPRNTPQPLIVSGQDG